MFIVKQSGEHLVQARDFMEAVKKAKEKMAVSFSNGDPLYFEVWDTFGQDFYVLEEDGVGKVEQLVHFTVTERLELVKKMKERASENKSELDRLCELAALQVRDKRSYDSWVRKDAENVDS